MFYVYFFVKDFYILPRCTEEHKRGHCTIAENPTFFLRHTWKPETQNLAVQSSIQALKLKLQFDRDSPSRVSLPLFYFPTSQADPQPLDMCRSRSREQPNDDFHWGEYQNDSDQVFLYLTALLHISIIIPHETLFWVLKVLPLKRWLGDK